MDKLKVFGLNLAAFVMLIVTVPIIIVFAAAFVLMYACFCVFDNIMWNYEDDDIRKCWDECVDIYSKICECMGTLFLDLKWEL